MATIYRGLNVTFYLNDIIDDREALLNLGLNQDDLDVINGISRGNDGITKDELKTVSGLNLDAQKELFSLYRSGQSIERILTDSDKVDYTNRVFDLDMEFNADVDGQLRAGAIKYKFYDYSGGGIRTADISTSRISSWSSIGTGAVTPTTPIIYGSQVEILGGKAKIAELGTTTSPAVKKYPAEVPTDTMTLNIGGTPRNFYVMRDIPLVAYGTFRTALFDHEVDPLPVTYNNGAQIRPVWRVENLNNPNDFLHTFSGDAITGQSSVGLTGAYRFSDRNGRSLTRKVEFYYHPDYIKYLKLSGIGMTDLPQASLTNVETLDFSFNQLQTLPAYYGKLTPNLINLNISLNAFNSANAAGINLTLQNFFRRNSSNQYMDKLETLTMQATFKGNESIDFSYLTALRTLSWNGYYNQYNYRRMNGTYFPVVSSASIENYEVSYHGFQYLPHEVNDAANLVNFTVNWTSLLGYEDSVGVKFRQLTLANSKTTLSTIQVTGGRTNVIDVKDFTNLKLYYHRHNNELGGSSSIDDKFSGGTVTGALEKLEQVNLYSTYITGQLGGQFGNKPALTTLDLRHTRLGPDGFSSTEFNGSPSLQNIYIQNGAFNTDNFFGNSVSSLNYSYPSVATVSDSQCLSGTDIRNFWAIDNRGIRGFLPDFSTNRNLSYLFLRNTNLTGEIPNFNLNTRLAFLRLEGSRFTGQLPRFNSAALRYIRLDENLFNSSLPEQNVRNCYLFYAQGNSILGTIPSWVNCTGIKFLNLSRNSFTGYTPTAISALTQLVDFDVSNNQLNASAIGAILSDLMANYAARTRRGVTVNLLGNNVTQETLSAEALSNLNTLRSYGWSVLI